MLVRFELVNHVTSKNLAFFVTNWRVSDNRIAPDPWISEPFIGQNGIVSFLSRYNSSLSYLPFVIREIAAILIYILLYPLRLKSLQSHPLFPVLQSKRCLGFWHRINFRKHFVYPFWSLRLNRGRTCWPKSVKCQENVFRALISALQLILVKVWHVMINLINVNVKLFRLQTNFFRRPFDCLDMLGFLFFRLTMHTRSS